jgi:hypothetical protein
VPHAAAGKALGEAGDHVVAGAFDPAHLAGAGEESGEPAHVAALGRKKDEAGDGAIGVAACPGTAREPVGADARPPGARNPRIELAVAELLDVGAYLGRCALRRGPLGPAAGVG